ncbi:putative 3-hydroxyacyl-CoA dehydrogenase [Enhygromyxa salina]|uniref:Putative 3-hydroxyacyl-CoA dehydrogenase n=2 Tax=Enhygromyxa salina TaxID=215803 RepID=A0A2S9Y7L2_9BACT|nr:putative 3-hydroxyacyl-CoA dehydrogenase [Enhygromyxa salina]
MGAGIAAHLANAGIRTYLLDIVPKGVGADAPKAARNKLAAGALKALPKAKPPALMLKGFAARITAGNFDDDLADAVGQSDIVIEAIVERLDIKRSVFKQVAAAAGEHTILATNTSGIPIGDIAEALPEGARERLLGLHFFNPPRWMHLLEVIPSKFTAQAIVDDVARFSDRVLGKGVVLCRDTPNFIGNRIGIGEMLLTFAATAEGNYTIEEVDTLNGKPVGRPKTGSYRLGDMVGLDVAGHVIRNLREALSGDPSADNYDPLHDKMQISPALQTLLDKGWYGDKAGQGFYKKTKDASGKRVILSLDLETGEYREQIKPDFPELKGLRGSPAAKVNKAMRLEGRAGDFYRKVYLPLFNYSATLTGKICDTPKQIDDAMKWGYGWGMGPFELMDAAGPAWCAAQMRELGIEPAPSIVKLLAQGDDATWYKGRPGKDQQIFDGEAYVDVETPAGMLILGAHKPEREIKSNSSAALIDIGDGVALLEFRSKANVLDEGVVTLMSEAPEFLREKGFDALVIGSQDDHFCRGANLLQIGMAAMQKKWDELDTAVNALQQTLMNLRHGPLPVVVAPYGQTLGGGCEVSMHADHIQAGADLFMGLVEIAVGVLPAGGGMKEIARRASAHAAQLQPGEVFNWVRRGFEAAATGKVSMSAFEARDTGWLSVNDGITFHKNRVVADAKRAALALAAGNYVPPDRNEPIHVMGAPGGANLVLGIHEFGWGGFASEHDQLIGTKMIHVLSGGMKPIAGTVTAQDLLDLEREAFLSLCGTEKTLARIQHMLDKRKPLRN